MLHNIHKTYNRKKDDTAQDNSESWDIESGHFFKATRMGYNLRMLRRIQLEDIAIMNNAWTNRFWYNVAVKLGIISTIEDAPGNQSIFGKIGNFFKNTLLSGSGIAASFAAASEQTEGLLDRWGKTVKRVLGDFKNMCRLGRQDSAEMSSKTDEDNDILPVKSSSLSSLNIGDSWKRASQSIHGLYKNVERNTGTFLNKTFSGAALVTAHDVGTQSLLPAYAKAAAPQELQITHCRSGAVANPLNLRHLRHEAAVG